MSGHSLDKIVSQIIAFIPVYTDQGDSTELWLQGGGRQIEVRSIRSCLREFWRHYSFDWQSYRRQYAVELNRRNLLPWPADVWRTFTPAKLRLPEIPRDPAYGYFAVEQIQAVLPVTADSSPSTMLIFRDGRQLPVYLQPREVHRHLQVAAYAFQIYWGKRLELRPTFTHLQ
jgi:hypothetical protein